MYAAYVFENARARPKGQLRKKQFGVSAGGPVVIPHVFDGRNKVFFFGDYEGFRRIQGTILTGGVPTVAERNSGFTDLSDRLQTKTETDPLGRTVFIGTIFDPTTTRPVTAGGGGSGIRLTPAPPRGCCGPHSTLWPWNTDLIDGGLLIHHPPLPRLQ